MKLYPEVRAGMLIAGETQLQLGLAMNKGPSYINKRFTGKESWTLAECYFLMDRYGIARHRIFEVFPPLSDALTPKPYAGQREKKRRLRLVSGQMLVAR